MRRPLGTIFGDTGAHKFKFAVTAPDLLRQGDYIKVWHPTDGWVLSQTTSIRRSSDLSFDEAKSIGTFTEIEEKVVAEGIVIGSRGEEGLLKSPRTPFSPGDRVFPADKDLILETIGLGKDGIYIGFLDGNDIKVMLDPNRFVQKHCSILAKTGSGKSYTAGVIVEELLDKGVPLVIIDPHGEYASLKSENESEGDLKQMGRYGITAEAYLDQVMVYTPANLAIAPHADAVFRLDGVNLDARRLSLMVPALTDTQLGLLYQSIKTLKERMDFYRIDDIINELGEIKSNTKWAIIHALELFKETGILSDSPTLLDELVKPRKASIIDMKGVDPKLQEILVSQLASQLFDARKIGRIPPLMLVIEEAHNFCPEKGIGKATSSDILRTIASEGRKFGLGLLVISQRPARVDKNILSQCNTQIILKVTNPNDLKALSKGLEGMSSDLEEEIKRIPAGMALIVSNDIEKPVLVDVRVRKTRHGGESSKIVSTYPASWEDYLDTLDTEDEVVTEEKGGGFLSRLFGRGV
ncbi:MAG: AAA-like domain protein [Candidatus Syntrophoarchaeum sp. GoM_oil]|nr:MAG: AAA-like domain protein [Candidatus Syntrophoarchaeum sp. GoM_oil]